MVRHLRNIKAAAGFNLAACRSNGFREDNVRNLTAELFSMRQLYYLRIEELGCHRVVAIIIIRGKFHSRKVHRP